MIVNKGTTQHKRFQRDNPKGAISAMPNIQYIYATVIMHLAENSIFTYGLRILITNLLNNFLY